MIPSSKIGRYVRRSGSEDVHVCGVCGREKLYLNRSDGVGYCFRCGEAVELSPDTSRRSHARSGDLPISLPITLADLRKLEPRGIRSFGARCCRSVQYAASHSSPALPLLLSDKIVGFVCYHGENAPLKYQTFGQRGLQRGRLTGKPLLLLEGFFDFLQVDQLDLEDTLTPVYTAGNRLTDGQVGELARWKPDRILIGFDTDLPAVPHRLKHRLGVFCRSVEFLLPPTRKDWDEELRHDPATFFRSLETLNL